MALLIALPKMEVYQQPGSPCVLNAQTFNVVQCGLMCYSVVDVFVVEFNFQKPVLPSYLARMVFADLHGPSGLQFEHASGLMWMVLIWCWSGFSLRMQHGRWPAKQPCRLW